MFLLGAASSIVNMRRITHPTVQQMLAGKAVLPCVFTLQTSSFLQPPQLLWTRSNRSAGGRGASQEEIVLSAKGKKNTNVVLILLLIITQIMFDNLNLHNENAAMTLNLLFQVLHCN